MVVVVVEQRIAPRGSVALQCHDIGKRCAACVVVLVVLVVTRAIAFMPPRHRLSLGCGSALAAWRRRSHGRCGLSAKSLAAAR